MTATRSQKLAPRETDYRRIVTAINQVIAGRTDNWGSVTLATATAQTIVSAVGISENSVILLSPTSDAARSASPWISAVDNGTFTIGHNVSSASRTFGFIWVG